MRKLAILAVLILAACSAQDQYQPLPYIPLKPICPQESELHIQFFRLCLNRVPEEKRSADDLKRCDLVAEVQAIDECTSLGYVP